MGRWRSIRGGPVLFLAGMIAAGLLACPAVRRGWAGGMPGGSAAAEEGSQGAIRFAGMGAEPAGIRLAFGYALPPPCSRLDVFHTTNLASAPAWVLAATVAVDPATNRLEWVDPEAPAAPSRFYLLGNADQDSDGDRLADAREQFLHGTCPTNADTDADGLTDGEELLDRATDPCNADRQQPSVRICFPSNFHRQVLIP